MMRLVVVSILNCTLVMSNWAANAGESDECEFRFVHPVAHIRPPGGEEIEAPSSEFGIACINQKTQSCLYEYWHDGIHSRPRAIIQTTPRTLDKRIGDSRAWLISAAGFDGEWYWLALFNPNEVNEKNGRIASIIVLNRTRSPHLPEQNRRDQAGGPLSWSWHDHAILHRLLNDLLLESVDKESLLMQLRKSPVCVALDDGRYVVHPGEIDASERQKDLPFRYTLRLSDAPCGIESCDVRWRGRGGSLWNFPVPRSFIIERVDNAMRDKKNYSWVTYKGPTTRVVERK